MLLPRPHISYSQYILWNRSKDQYMKQYYYGEETFSTQETRFGSEVHKELEHSFESFGPIIREHRIKVFIEGVPVYAIIDEHNTETHYFSDTKTGRVKWDAVKVRKLKQLPFYAVVLDEAYGLDPNIPSKCGLDWIETEKIKGMKLGPLRQADTISKTGEEHTFERIIMPYEKELMRKDIIRTAHEISQDYCRHLRALDI